MAIKMLTKRYLYDYIERDLKKKTVIITGSARLDLYSRGGDSLQGRCFFYRLHPFSLGELGGNPTTTLASLLKFGGFPEPFFAADETTWRRWHADRIRRVLRDDLTSLETVKDIELVSLLAELLPFARGHRRISNGFALYSRPVKTRNRFSCFA